MPRPRRPVLLHGPYRAPALRVGDMAFCLPRDADVVITSWTDAPLSWPRCRAVDCPRGGSGLLVDEELARAIRSESSLAIQHWWGVNAVTVWRWRKAFGVGPLEPEGSRRLHAEAVAKAAGDATRGTTTLAERVERMAATRKG